jgi:C4-type Zn-finger protein
MRVSQITITCPVCRSQRTLTLIEHDSGPHEGDQELVLECGPVHGFSRTDLLNLWTAAHAG